MADEEASPPWIETVTPAPPRLQRDVSLCISRRSRRRGVRVERLLVRRFVQGARDGRLDAVEPLAARLEVPQFVLAVEHVERRYVLVLEAADDGVLVVDRDRLRELHVLDGIG